METHRVEKVVQSNGVVVLEDLPFNEGEKVEVTVVRSENKRQNGRYPLRGTKYKYDDPFSPVVPPEDWEVLR